ncbi:UDP-glycosyltransferase 75C1 [Euphorbia peplus]|nr:UDP-glycosyltransferase 75C1 [Euphorbia peplus]
MSEPHFLLITFPAQGHLNPALQFAKRLMRIGVRVTLSTTIHAKRRMSLSTFPDGISLAAFSDGFDDGFKPKDEDDSNYYVAELERRGSQTLSDLILAADTEGKPFTCLVYTLLLPWAAKVARAHHIHSTLLWIQPATVLDIYYYYFNGYENMFANCNDSSYEVNLPGGLPGFTPRDLPSFLVPGNPYSRVLAIFEEQLSVLLEEEEKPKVLVNTFDALEVKALKAVESMEMFGIGPLLPSAFLDGKDPSDISFGGDLFQCSKDYVEWLNSKEEASVVYISFGSIASLSNKQMEEIGKALLKSEYPFLWVIREDQKSEVEDKLSCREELEEKGLIIPWCSQVQVLSHRALGCFVTHCGWNSTLESIVSGTPVVAFPQWTDQGTNAKLIEEEWKIGVRVVPNEELGVVESEEIRRCLDIIMGKEGGEKIGEEVRKNAKKWKEIAREAVMDKGSSDINLRAFVDDIV